MFFNFVYIWEKNEIFVYLSISENTNIVHLEIVSYNINMENYLILLKPNNPTIFLSSLKNKMLSFVVSCWYKGHYNFRRKSLELTVNFT